MTIRFSFDSSTWVVGMLSLGTTLKRCACACIPVGHSGGFFSGDCIGMHAGTCCDIPEEVNNSYTIVSLFCFRP